MNKILLIVISVFLLTGCYNAPDAIKPHSWLFKQMPQDAPNKYKHGWKDGCESGMSSMTSTTYKTFYSFKQDPILRKDPTYYKAWKDTFNFCRHYAYGTLRQADIRMNLPNERSQFLTTFMGTENILEHGLLQMWGPGGGTLKFLKNFGGDYGSLGREFGMGGAMDFSDDMVMNGKGKNPIMNWEFKYEY
ncbi:MAG: hypothetical protein PQ612_03075 [Rickettsiales bacterium]|nr:hypothetical protein [Pseudomonadota bacterium]MDA0965906.1 hypothetical protein [Pseudomonadota bacterium]MDG4542624.1 hypothetical protein [Rickettsiales bacterium]MDG4545128.1 hypothetical protein [Rickettsiales bacterium]MDG4547251.1 hypothetical protein [Rickettsiales bacterium]